MKAELSSFDSAGVQRLGTPPCTISTGGLSRTSHPVSFLVRHQTQKVLYGASAPIETSDDYSYLPVWWFGSISEVQH